MKNKFLLITVIALSFASCVKSDKVAGNYNGTLEHNGVNVDATAYSIADGTSELKITISSSFGQFQTNKNARLAEDGSILFISLIDGYGGTNSMTTISGYYDPNDKYIIFDYVLDTGSGNVTGSFSGHK